MSDTTAMTLLTTLSVLVAVMAALVAVKANREAARATKQARKANRLSRKANVISTQSNQIAQDASAHSKSLPTDLAWDEAISAVGAIQAFDAAGREPLGDRMAVIRVRLMLLIDRLEWDGFDTWIARELQCINLLAREADAKGRVVGDAVKDAEVALRLNAPFLTAVSGFTSNLRFFRKTGPEARAIDFLTAQAISITQTVSERNGWPAPPDSVPGLESLDLSDLD